MSVYNEFIFRVTSETPESKQDRQAVCLTSLISPFPPYSKSAGIARYRRFCRLIRAQPPQSKLRRLFLAFLGQDSSSWPVHSW